MHDLSDEQFFQKHADFCAVFSNANRLKLLDILSDGDTYTVSELESAAGLSQSAVSQHLKLMRDQNIVVRDRRGVNSYYRLSDTRIVEAMERIREAVADQMVE